MADSEHIAEASEVQAAQKVPVATPRVISSADIFRGEREVLIQHGEEVYRLRLTRNGKLILHK